MSSGKLSDVAWEYQGHGNFIIWADKGNSETISSVEGVFRVFTQYDTRYEVHIDPRYGYLEVLENILNKLTREC